MTNRFPTVESTGAIRRWWAPAIALAVLAALFPAPPADAAARKWRAPRKPPRRRPRARPASRSWRSCPIKSQKVTLYDADGWILRAPVSTGQKGHETPAGVFAVVEKNKDHRSNLYDDAWMPHMLRVTWNGIALHGGPLPGHPASKGCVRLPFGFAEKLFDKMRISTRVIISPNDAEPVAFSHPALFVPNPQALAAAPARAETLAREADEAAQMAKQAKSAVATSKREAASLTASLRKLEQAQHPREAALAAPRRGSPPPRRTRPGPRPKASSRRPPQGRGAAHAARHRQGQREGKARRGRGGPGQRQGGRDQAGRHRQSSARGQARARAGLGVHQPRDAEALRSAQHA